MKCEPSASPQGALQRADFGSQRARARARTARKRNGTSGRQRHVLAACNGALIDDLARASGSEHAASSIPPAFGGLHGSASLAADPGRDELPRLLRPRMRPLRLESRDNGQGNAKECEGNGRREKGGGRKYTPVRALSFSERERESRHLRER